MSEGVAARRATERIGWGRRRGTEPVDAETILARPGGDDPLPDVGPPPATTSQDRQVRKTAERRLADQNEALVIAWLDRLATAEPPFVEKMTWFWHGHFATASTKVRSAQLMAMQNATQRRLAIGSFLDLAQAMAVDPAMLVWLDGQDNRRNAPNENLGRELMELFVLGVGHYTEEDVRQAARALTGWSVDRTTLSASFRPEQAAPGVKTVLGEPVTDVRSLVSVLVARPESARFVVGRVWSRFVSVQPPSPDAMERLTAAFGERRDIGTLMRAVVAEPAFVDPASVLVKQPVEWSVGLMRALGVRPGSLTDKGRVALRGSLKALGQLPFDPPNVGGWPEGGSWLTTGAALGRQQLADLVAGNADLSSIEQTKPIDRVDGVLDLLGIVEPTVRTREALRTVTSDPRTLVSTAACAPEYVVSR